MEWAKAKNILIVLLLLLNLFLVSSIVFNRSNNSIEPDYVKAAAQILATRQIQVNVPLPAYHEASGWIEYGSDGLQTGLLARQILGEPTFLKEAEFSAVNGIYNADQKLFVQPYAFQNDSIVLKIDPAGTFRYDGPGIGRMFAATTVTDLDKQMRAWFLEAGLDGVTMRLQSSSFDNEFVLTYVQTYRDMPIFQNLLFVRVQNGQLVTMSGVIRPIQKENAIKSILSIHQLLIMSELPPNSVVTDIQFGWTTITDGELYDVPVWRITLLDRSVRYFLAITGELVLEEII